MFLPIRAFQIMVRLPGPSGKMATLRGYIYFTSRINMRKFPRSRNARRCRVQKLFRCGNGSDFTWRLTRWSYLFGRRISPHIITYMVFRSYKSRWPGCVLPQKHRQGRAPPAKFAAPVVKNGVRASFMVATDPLPGPLLLNLSIPRP